MHLQGPSLGEATIRGDNPSNSWVHRQISSIFHGEPYVLSARTRSSPRVQKFSAHRHLSPTPNSNPQAGQRSPTSVRSLIDPSASPISSAGSIPRNDFGTVQMHTNPPSVAYTRPRSGDSGARAERHLSRALSNPHRRRARRGSRRSRRHWTCLPNIRNPKHRRKAIGCLVTGAILTVMLSTCKLRFFSPLMKPKLRYPIRPCTGDLEGYLGPNLARHAHHVYLGHSHTLLSQPDPFLHARSSQQKARSNLRGSKRT